jgi:HSP20 family protein
MNLTLKPKTSTPSVLTEWLQPDSIFNQDLFDLSYGLMPMQVGVNVPSVNIKETPKEFILEFAAPGLERKDFHINVDNHNLTISAEKEEKKETKKGFDDYWRKEYSYNSFSRTFTLPKNVKEDKIDAKYDKGILIVHVPKTKETALKAGKKIVVS